MNQIKKESSGSPPKADYRSPVVGTKRKRPMPQITPSPEKKTGGGRVFPTPQTTARNPDTQMYACRFCFSKTHWSNDWNWTDENKTDKAWICEKHPDEEVIPNVV